MVDIPDGRDIRHMYVHSSLLSCLCIYNVGCRRLILPQASLFAILFKGVSYCKPFPFFDFYASVNLILISTSSAFLELDFDEDGLLGW